MSLPLDVRFFVPGDPVVKGNHDAFPISRGPCVCGGRGCTRRNCYGGVIVGAVITDSKGEELKSWEAFVRAHSTSARNKQGMPIVAPPHAVEVRLIFMLERPAGHWTKRGVLSAEGTRKPLPTVKPDWDKLSRATADALTGGLVEDDAQIAVADVAKIYTSGKPGVLIRARQIGTLPDWVSYELAAAGIEIPSHNQVAMF